MLIFVLEAAIRSLLMAAAVWTAIRLLRVQAVLAQKIAWVMVLAAAGAMPLVMHSPWLAVSQAVKIPISKLSFHRKAPQPAQNPLVAARLQSGSHVLIAPQATHTHHKSKPSAAHIVRLDPDAQPGDSTMALQETLSVSPAVMADAPYVMLQTSPSAPSLFSRAIRFWTWTRLRTLFISLYLAVASLLLLRTLIGLAIAFRIWRSAQPANDMARAFDLSTSVRISRHLKSPVTIGSSVILPADCRTWDETKLRIVLAHEHAHVRQGDFYLQLLAAVYVAASWFSPLGWWLQRKLSELGEALSDRAGLEEAPDAVSYAQVLLEFAARPRLTVPLAGVAMARSSNLSSRIERILNDRRFRLAFLGGRRHAFVVAGLVPAALFAVTAFIRIVPAVEAAQARTASSASLQSQTGSSSTSQTSGAMDSKVANDVTSQTANDASNDEDLVTTTISRDDRLQSPPAPQIAPAPPAPSAEIAPVLPTPEVDEAPEPAPLAPSRGHAFAYQSSHGDGESFAIIHGKDSTVTLSGDAGKNLAQVRQKMHGDFIWFERDGKSYVITDPAILAKSRAFFQQNPELQRQQARLKEKQEELNRQMAELNAKNQPRSEAMSRLQGQLGAKQSQLNREMAEFSRQMAKAEFDSPAMQKQMAEMKQEIAKAQLDSPEMKREMAEFNAQVAKAQVDSPEMKKEMAQLSAKLAELQSDKFKKMTEEMHHRFSEEALSELQEKVGEIQGQIGEIQGTLGEQMGRFGEQQGELGEKMGELGEEMGRIGEEQGRHAEEASRKVKSLIDKAYKEGKAKPVN